MPKKIKLILVILSILLWNYCKSDKQQKTITIKENLTESGLNFHLVKKIKLDVFTEYPRIYKGVNKIYVVHENHNNASTKVNLDTFDTDLNKIASREFPIGQGPGDLGGFSRFYDCGNQIIVPDNTQQRVNIFDKNFKFIKFEKISLGLNILFFDNCKYYLKNDGTQIRTNFSYKYSIYSFPEKKKKFVLIKMGPFSDFDSKRHKFVLFQSPHFQFYDSPNYFYFIDQAEYKIIQYDKITGKTIKTIKVITPEKRIPEKMKDVWVRESLSERHAVNNTIADIIQPVALVVKLSNGFVAIRRDHYSQECSGQLDGDYFDWNLQLKGKLKFPCIHGYNSLYNFWINAPVLNNHLYLISVRNEEYYLEKWRIGEK